MEIAVSEPQPPPGERRFVSFPENSWISMNISANQTFQKIAKLARLSTK